MNNQLQIEINKLREAKQHLSTSQNKNTSLEHELAKLRVALESMTAEKERFRSLLNKSNAKTAEVEDHASKDNQ